MDSRAIEIRLFSLCLYFTLNALLLSDGRSLAERNEDINRRRIAKQSNGAPLKVH